MAIDRTHSDNFTATTCGSNENDEQQNGKEWNRHCFQIVHAHNQDGGSGTKTTTRIFTAPIEERNEWVFAMNNALLAYEKRLGKARSDAAKNQCMDILNVKKARTASIGIDSCIDMSILCGDRTEEKEEGGQKQLSTTYGTA